MTTGLVECHYCGKAVAAELCTAQTIEVKSGRSGGSWSFGLSSGQFGRIGKTSRNSLRYNTGRKSYRYEPVDVCPACIEEQARLQDEKDKRNILVAKGVAVVVVLLLIFGWVSSRSNGNSFVSNKDSMSGVVNSPITISNQPIPQTSSPVSTISATNDSTSKMNSNGVSLETIAAEWAKCQASMDWSCAEAKARILAARLPGDVQAQNLEKRTALAKSIHRCTAAHDLSCVESDGNKLLELEPSNDALKTLVAKVTQDRLQTRQKD